MKISHLVLLVASGLLLGAVVSGVSQADWRMVAALGAASASCFVGWGVVFRRRHGSGLGTNRTNSNGKTNKPSGLSRLTDTVSTTSSGLSGVFRFPSNAEPDDAESLVDTMLHQNRYALLLRPQIAKNLGEEHYEQAFTALRESMTLTPQGEVLLRGRYSMELDTHDATSFDRVVPVDAQYLDRYAVTNAQFREFVKAGGYEQMSLWCEEIWPAVLEFVDRTGQPGPRFWRDGRFPKGEANRPVVGVSWYEASAYARWVGKLLPSDAQWVRAAAWPVPTKNGPPIQRKFPWGNSMDHELANLFCTGLERTCDVSQFSEGASVGGVHQLVGNVWEWTSTDFGEWDPPERQLELAIPLKSIRGGAFDTYFDNQASNQFQSGESPVNRRHNIGFRCAVALADLETRSGGKPSEKNSGQSGPSSRPGQSLDPTPSKKEYEVVS